MSPSPESVPSSTGCSRVAAARAGDSEAVEAAMEFARASAMGAVLVNWRGRRLDTSAREDVVQETLTRVLQGITQTEKPVKDLQDWVRGTVDLVLRESWKQSDRQPLELEPERSNELPSDDLRPPDTLLASERRTIVWECVDDLPAHYRRMLLLRYRERCSNADIATQLEKTEKAVERAVPRALKLVRDCLERKKMAP